jgi:hypothetical protein
MTSQDTTTVVIDNDTLKASTESTRATLSSAFDLMLQPQPTVPTQSPRDRCARPIPVYNTNYNPHKAPSDDQPAGYSFYVFREPLFNNREVIVANPPKKHVLAEPVKEPRVASSFSI